MKITRATLPDVLILEPAVFRDDRGYFMETYNTKDLPKKWGHCNFVQDNESLSKRGTLRGLHYQAPPHAQSKLIRVVSGHVLDVVVDIRKGSPTFGEHFAIELSGENKKQLLIPRGFAHGFFTLSDTAICVYKCDNHYNPKAESGIAYNDPDLGIEWPLLAKELIITEKDKQWPRLKDSVHFNFEA